MSNVKVVVLAQVLENYGFDSGSEHWKKKGGITFNITLNSDLVMYADDLKANLIELVKKEGNDLEKFEYIGHDVIFNEVEIDPNKLTALILRDAEKLMS